MRMLSSMFRNLFYHGPKLSVLHEKYAKQKHIDRRAPIRSRSEIIIDAPVSAVWSIVTDIPSWPTLDSQFSGIRLSLPVQVDKGFKFTINNFPITAQFAVVEPERELTWSGRFFWVNAVDRHVLERIDAQTTRLSVEESMAGALLPLFFTNSQLQRQHRSWLAAMKNAAEKSKRADY